MTHFNTLTHQGGKATPLGLVVKLVVIFAIGAVVVLLATSAAKPGDRLAQVPMPSAHAEGTASPAQILPSSAQAKTWDRVLYGPDDWISEPGQIED